VKYAVRAWVGCWSKREREEERERARENALCVGSFKDAAGAQKASTACMPYCLPFFTASYAHI